MNKDSFSPSNIDEVPPKRKNPENKLPEAPYANAEEYDMNHSKRGTALIFNHMEFSIPKVPARLGTNKDRDDLQAVFRKFNFEVLVFDDLPYAKIEDILYSVATMDHTDEDCLVVVVMSHGDQNVLYAEDQEYPTSDIWKYFSGDGCPSLAGKPKLFFIQACRGDKFDYGVQVSGIATDASSPKNQTYKLPTTADILIMYSTVEGYYSWRNPTDGSYFIQSLVYQLSANSDGKDLLRILTAVNRQVAIEYSSLYPENCVYREFKQMCSIVSMLTRLVYLRKN